MNNKIAIFIDIDGTLYDHRNQEIPKNAVNIIKQLSKSDKFDLYLATGRSIATLKQVEFLLPYFKGFNLTNGQAIYIDNKLIFEGRFKTSFAHEFLKYVKENNYSTGIITLNQIYMNFFDDTSRQNFSSYCDVPIIDLNHKPYASNEPIDQFWVFAYPSELDIIAKDFPQCSVMKWGPYGADVVPLGCSKAKGIEYIANKMGYLKENLYAIGDGDNDIPMFQVVGHSIAMGNASEQVKKYADEITDFCDNDGLYKALYKIVNDN